MRLTTKTKAVVATGVMLAAGGMLTVAMITPASAAPASSAPPGKGTAITQTGVVTSPVAAATTGKSDGEAAFKVTGADGKVEAWIVTAKASVTRNGTTVPPSAIAKGDHVTISGVDDGKLVVAGKVVDQG